MGMTSGGFPFVVITYRDEHPLHHFRLKDCKV